MKKLLRILPYITMVWVAMYVNKKTGEIEWRSDEYKPSIYWATKKQCMKAAKEIEKDKDGDDFYVIGKPRRWWRPSNTKPVCYRLTKYSEI